jgi:enoyl-CoA hydratase
MSPSPHLLVEVADAVATLTLNRPERRNALSPEMIVRLASSWRQLRDDPAVSVVVLTGAPGGTFCAGADLGSLIPLLAGHRPAADEWDEKLLADRRLMDQALLRNVDFYKPVVAAVNGHAIAGGTEILLGTDLRIAASGATFGLTEVRRGIVAGGGEPISAEDALRHGLVNRLVAPADVVPTAMDLARRIALGAPLALAAAKEAVVTTSGLPLADAYRIENRVAGRVFATADAREGPLAYMEKRAPVWSGR